MYSRRENVLLGYSPRRSLMNYSGYDSLKSPYRTSDVDFNDVFGGPPRRSSLQEMRHTFGDATDSSSPRNEDGALLSRPHRWSGLGEKPVFGDEVGNRRRHPSNDFFDDIFKGFEPASSSPRKQDRDLFSSSPGSRVLSPVPPLPSRPEPFGSPLPEQFSLPAKLVKGPDLPTFGSSTRNHNRSKNDASNSSSFSYSPLSRTSNQANQNERGLTQDIRCRSSLSREFSLDDVDQPNSQKPYQSGQEINLEMDSNSSGNAGSGSQFHFSIYKWAGKGVPLPMPFRGGSATRLKEKSKLERCSSANGRMACEVTERKLSIATPCSVDSSPVIHGVSSDNTSIGVERVKEDNGFLGKVKQYEIMNESETPIRDSVIVKSIAAETASLNSREETKSHSVPDTGLRGKTEAKSPEITKKDDESGPKPLRSMLFEDNNDQGVDYPTRKNGVKENKAKNTKKSSAVFDFSDNVKKQDDRSTLNSDNIDKPSLQGSLKISQNNIEKKNRGRGKVKEFVKMFNQEVPKENKVDLKSPSPSSIWKERWKPSTEDEASVNTNKIKENVPLPNVKMNNASDAFVKLQELHQEKRASKHKAADAPSIRKYVSGSKKESAPDGSEAICGDAEAFFHENFQVKELHQNEDKQQSEENLDVDTKIRRWANGKEGNIRSLLSTLQYVLWPESGWKPVPLVNIIEGNAVKRSYQKALLYLHPDKLQQKGATSEQKYIAEKVFDVLQEAWTHFNILGSV